MVSLVIKLLIELQKFQEGHHRIIQRKLEMSMIKKYLKREIYISPEGTQKIIDDLGLI